MKMIMTKRFLMIFMCFFTNIVYSSPRFLGLEYTNNVAHLGARHLSLITGRFLNQDLKKQYLSHYNYGKGDIMTISDPTGYGGGFSQMKKMEEIFDKTVADSIQETRAEVLTKENIRKTKAQNNPKREELKNPTIETDSDNFSDISAEGMAQFAEDEAQSLISREDVALRRGETMYHSTRLRSISETTDSKFIADRAFGQPPMVKGEGNQEESTPLKLRTKLMISMGIAVGAATAIVSILFISQKLDWGPDFDAPPPNGPLPTPPSPAPPPPAPCTDPTGCP